jgi:hypothetical protein
LLRAETQAARDAVAGAEHARAAAILAVLRADSATVQLLAAFEESARRTCRLAMALRSVEVQYGGPHGGAAGIEFPRSSPRGCGSSSPTPRHRLPSRPIMSPDRPSSRTRRGSPRSLPSEKIRMRSFLACLRMTTPPAPRRPSREKSHAHGYRRADRQARPLDPSELDEGEARLIQSMRRMEAADRYQNGRHHR